MPLAQIVWSPLTTIDQPVRALAGEAADSLLASGDAVERLFEHALTHRESTGARAA